MEKSHSTFITGLEFLPGGDSTEVVRGFSDASVVSISVDYQVCVHHVPRLSESKADFFWGGGWGQTPYKLDQGQEDLVSEFVGTCFGIFRRRKNIF